MYAAPALLTTGEVGGHGRAVVPLVGANLDAVGGPADLLLLSGAGGMTEIDLNLLAPVMGERFASLRSFYTTDEVGAAADGSPTAPINIGHTQGATSTPGYLYVADGPHGVTVWDILGDDGLPIDDPHVVGNTLQDEYPQTVGDVTVYPATHAWGVVLDAEADAVYTLYQSVGLRRLPIGSVEAGEGAVGMPLHDPLRLGAAGGAGGRRRRRGGLLERVEARGGGPAAGPARRGRRAWLSGLPSAARAASLVVPRPRRAGGGPPSPLRGVRGERRRASPAQKRGRRYMGWPPGSVM